MPSVFLKWIISVYDLLTLITIISQLYPGKITHLCQKLCSVVYPVMEENPEPIVPQKNAGNVEDE